jgi:hypothetical protein
MPRNVSYNGKIHQFPDGVSDDEIAAALEGQDPPGASVRSVETDPPSGFNPGRMARDFISGIGAGAAKTVTGLGELGTRIANTVGAREEPGSSPLMPNLSGAFKGADVSAFDAARAEIEEQTPKSLSAAAGEGLEQMGEFALPGGATKGMFAGRGLAQLAGRAAVRGVEGAAVQAGREGDLDESALTAGALGAAGEGLVTGGAATARVLYRSALRSYANLLKPRTQVEWENVERLAQRVLEEKLAPGLSTRATQLNRAEDALADATGARKGVEAGLQGATVDARSVLQRGADEIPAVLPGGQIPAQGKPLRKGAERALEDAQAVVQATGAGTTRVPLPAAQAEKRRLDTVLKGFYEGGRDKVPVSAQFTKSSADAWRGAINDQFPELGAANLREHELIQVTSMLRRALSESRFPRNPEGAAGAAGAGALGRFSVPAAFLARLGVGSGPLSSASARVKLAVSGLLERGGALDFLRLAAQAGVPEMSATEEVLETARRRQLPSEE